MLSTITRRRVYGRRRYGPDCSCVIDPSASDNEQPVAGSERISSSSSSLIARCTYSADHLLSEPLVVSVVLCRNFPRSLSKMTGTWSRSRRWSLAVRDSHVLISASKAVMWWIWFFHLGVHRKKQGETQECSGRIRVKFSALDSLSG